MSYVPRGNARRRAKARRKSRLLRYFLIVTLLTVMFFGVSTLGLIASAFQKLPQLEKGLENAQSSKIYAADDSLVATLFVEQNREIIPLDEMPEYLAQAVIAIEDERFFRHGGVDLQAVTRALFVNIERGKVVEGGSTITQQYIKNAFITPERTVRRKLLEAVLSYELERRYSKQVILEKYMNTVYFGQSSYGVQAASQTFFGKSTEQLTLAEAALLAGLIRSPNYYSPFSDLERPKARRNVVLKKMTDLDYISETEAQEAMDEPIRLVETSSASNIAPYFVEHVKQLMLDDETFGSTPTQRYNYLFKGGLRIHTTLDPEMQKAAESAVAKTLDFSGAPSAALVAIDPRNGDIKALVGGADFKNQKFNLATQGKRQAGSAFKPFVLATAFEKDKKFTPYKVYSSAPLTISLPGQDWKVENYAGSGGAPMTVWKATVNSVNAVFARLVMDVSAKAVVTTGKKMGITSSLNAVPSIALGTQEVTPLEMASAYGTIARGGTYVKPEAISKITDSENKVIIENDRKEEPSLKPGTAYGVTQILKDVVSYGTGRRARISRQSAGKTGTTQSYRDAWFVGYTKELVASVWVGYPQAQIAMVPPRTPIRVVGGSYPAQIWSRFMTKALEDTPPSRFTRPEGVKNLVSDVAPSTTTTSIPGTGEETDVPSVVGMTADQAVDALWSAGFKVNRVYREKADVATDVVYEQSPAGDTSAPEGAAVTIVISNEGEDDDVAEPPPTTTTTTTVVTTTTGATTTILPPAEP